MSSHKAEGMGADLVRQALGFQLLLFESLLQSKDLRLVFLHGQLHHLARLGDPLIRSRPAREAQVCFQETPTTACREEAALSPARLQVGQKPNRGFYL